MLYRHDGSNKPYCTVGLGSHSEWKKFGKGLELSIGAATILSYDLQSGTNGLCALEIERNSLVEFDMENYFMAAEAVTGKKHGGKHTVWKGHQIFPENGYRIVVLFRELQEDALKAAMRHYHVCKNNDFKCFCLNSKEALQNF